jgi:hypothetical protein
LAFDREVDHALADIKQAPQRWPIGANVKAMSFRTGLKAR